MASAHVVEDFVGAVGRRAAVSTNRHIAKACHCAASVFSRKRRKDFDRQIRACLAVRAGDRRLGFEPRARPNQPPAEETGGSIGTRWNQEGPPNSHHRTAATNGPIHAILW